jgi:hypothetical protein
LHADFVKTIDPKIKIRKQHICAGMAKKAVCDVRHHDFKLRGHSNNT